MGLAEVEVERRAEGAGQSPRCLCRLLLPWGWPKVKTSKCFIHKVYGATFSYARDAINIRSRVCVCVCMCVCSCRYCYHRTLSVLAKAFQIRTTTASDTVR